MAGALPEQPACSVQHPGNPDTLRRGWDKNATPQARQLFVCTEHTYRNLVVYVNHKFACLSRFETQVVLVRGLVQKVRNQQAGTLAENGGSPATRHPKCSGLARNYLHSLQKRILDRIWVLVSSNHICKSLRGREDRGENFSEARAALRRGQCCCKADHNSKFWAHLGYFQREESKLLHRLSIINPDFFLLTSFNDLIFTGWLIWILLYKDLVFCLVRFLVSKPVCEADQVNSSETKLTPSFCQQWNKIKQHNWELLSNLCPRLHGGHKKKFLWYQKNQIWQDFS